MRVSLALGFSGLAILCLSAPAWAGAGASAPAKTVENPWKALPVGTVFGFDTVTEEGISTSPEIQRKERSEVWTIVAKDAKHVTIEIAVDGKNRRETRGLEPVPAFPEPDQAPAEGVPARAVPGGPDGEDHPSVVRDRLETPFGTFDCVRIDHSRVMLEGGSQGSEWRAPGFPEPLRATRLSAGGVGVVRSERETRTMVRFEKPGVPGPRAGPVPAAAATAAQANWRGFPVGTTFEVLVQTDHEVELPPNIAPTHEEAREVWTLAAKEEKSARFEVETGGVKRPETLPIDLPGLPEPGDTGISSEERTHVAIEKETIETPLGKLDCTRVRRQNSMIDAGGMKEEWRASGFPIAVKTREEWSHKQQVDVTTRTVLSFDRAAK